MVKAYTLSKLDCFYKLKNYWLEYTNIDIGIIVLFPWKTEMGIYKSLSLYQAAVGSNCKLFAKKILPESVEIILAKLCISLQERWVLTFG